MPHVIPILGLVPLSVDNPASGASSVLFSTRLKSMTERPVNFLLWGPVRFTVPENSRVLTAQHTSSQGYSGKSAREFTRFLASVDAVLAVWDGEDTWQEALIRKALALRVPLRVYYESPLVELANIDRFLE